MVRLILTVMKMKVMKQMNDFKLMQGDCLELMKDIPDGSIDMILCDLPFGTMQNAKKGTNLYKENEFNWDIALKPLDLFSAAEKVLRPNGKMVLFSQEPYTSKLVSNAIPALPFSYKAIWKKTVAGHPLGAKKNMMSYFEEICIFSKPCPKHDFGGDNPNRTYFKKVLDYIGFSSCKQVNEVLGHRKAEHCFYVTGKRSGSTQFSICTENVYNELISIFSIDKMEGFKEYSELRKLQDDFQTKHIEEMNRKYPSVFNLWQGGKSKSNVLEYSKDKGGYHPTQKPVLLLADLVKTYTNEGDVVLDNCMGSGSTGVACVNTNRKFIGMELDKQYFDIACKRIAEAEALKGGVENAICT